MTHILETHIQEPPSARFARHVRRTRKKYGWSQAELGRRVGLKQARISTIEKTGSVTIDQAAAIAEAFGTVTGTDARAFMSGATLELPLKFNPLTVYNAEVARGLVHTAEYDRRMGRLNDEFREWFEMLQAEELTAVPPPVS